MKRINYLIFGAISLTNICAYAGEEVPLTPQQNQEITRRAMSNALDNLFIDSNLIKESNKRLEEAEKSQVDILRPPAQQNIRKLRIAAGQEAKVHALNVYPNQITAITITDSMGEPWPLSASPLVASDSYVATYQDAMPGFLTVQTKSKFIPSNMVLSLKGKLRPIQFQLISDNKSLDSMLEITIEGKSPLNQLVAVKPFGGLDIPEHDKDGIRIFLSSPPLDATPLAVIGDNAIRAWRWGNKTVVRAPYSLLDPSDPIDVQSRMDSQERVYLLKKNPDVMAFLNIETSEIINVQMQSVEE